MGAQRPTRDQSSLAKESHRVAERLDVTQDVRREEKSFSLVTQLEKELTQISPAWVGAFLAVMLVALPLAGNLWPARISFLLAMRYYAGNWAWSVWLLKGESHRKLANGT